MSSKETGRSPYTIIRGNLVRGLAVLFPFYLTIIMVRFLITTISKPLSYPIRWIARLFTLDIKAYPIIENSLIVGISLILTLSAIFFVGFLAQRMFGKRIMKLFEVTFERLPLISTLYRTFREFTKILMGDTGETYKKVVLVAIPGSCGKTIGFVTASLTLEDQVQYLMVFVPTAPNISTGFLLLLPQNEVLETSLSTEEAFKIIVSIGILNKRIENSVDPEGH